MENCLRHVKLPCFPNATTCVCAFPPQVSDATGSMKLTKVSEKSPFAQELLARDDCFILDNGANGKVFVWKGETVLCAPTPP